MLHYFNKKTMEEEELKLREALEKNGAKLNEDQVKFVTAMELSLREAFKANDGKIAEAIRAKIEELTLKDSDDIKDQLRNLATTIEKIEKTGNIGLSDDQKRHLKTAVKENKEKIISAIREKRSLGSDDLGFLQLRVPAPHLNSNGTVTVGSGVVIPTIENYEDDTANIAEIRFPEYFILGVIRNRQVQKVTATRFKTEQTATEGDAAIVLEAGTKPLIQYKFVKNALSRKKYAGRIEWSEEFEMDNDSLFNAIVRMFEDTVIRKWNNGLVADIIANAVPYTSSPQDGTVAFPNASDVALVLQGLIGANNYEATTVVVNPVTLVNLALLKNVDGDYISNPLFVNGRLNGMRVIANNTMAVGQILVFDDRIYREDHSRFIIRIGTYNDQFITNEYTMIGEVFSLLDVAKIDLVASRYGSIETIIAALEAEPA